MSIGKYALLGWTASLLFIGTLGMAGGMEMLSSAGGMQDCPLMGVPAVCHMTPLDHAFALQHLLTVPPSSGLLTFLIALLALSIPFLAPRIGDVAILSAEHAVRAPPRMRTIALRHSLQEAFASGILHSKAF
ncbi:MAG TPA: hypothetical protein VMV62_02330 [Candidatus Paceibacterota bacterium]|nr:hypothetical protein [Candidatus Paceibacterota bacterium]